MSERALGKQFSNYRVTPNPDFPREVVAQHGTSGRTIGYLNWHRIGGEHNPETKRWEGATPVVNRVQVQSRYRRKGIASALWDAAREIEPNLQHSKALTEEGRAWVEGVSGRERRP